MLLLCIYGFSFDVHLRFVNLDTGGAGGPGIFVEGRYPGASFRRPGVMTQYHKVITSVTIDEFVYNVGRASDARQSVSLRPSFRDSVRGRFNLWAGSFREWDVVRYVTSIADIVCRIVGGWLSLSGQKWHLCVSVSRKGVS